VLWGECDAASAILFYAHTDARVKGLVLLNPWARTPAGEAKAILRFYYFQRLVQLSFWRKIIGMSFNPVTSIVSAMRLYKRASSRSIVGRPFDKGSLHERLLLGITYFQGPVLLVLSGRDLIAREFEAMVMKSGAWRKQFLSKPVTRQDLPDCDHTFSSAEQRSQVASCGLSWLRCW
jgi:hypothetical protein